MVQGWSSLLMPIVVAVPMAAIPYSSWGADRDDWTVATLASDGSWGVATDLTVSRALAAADRACREMAVTPSDCGAQTAQTRDGWIVARLCARHKILETAADRAKAEREAHWSERALRRTYVPDLPACRPVFTVEPGGLVVITGPHHVGPP
jgi:hypothetical protein